MDINVTDDEPLEGPVQKTDSKGELEWETDASGEYVLDAVTNEKIPVKLQAVDPDGAPMFESDGTTPIYVYRTKTQRKVEGSTPDEWHDEMKKMKDTWGTFKVKVAKTDGSAVQEDDLFVNEMVARVASVLDPDFSIDDYESGRATRSASTTDPSGTSIYMSNTRKVSASKVLSWMQTPNGKFGKNVFTGEQLKQCMEDAATANRYFDLESRDEGHEVDPTTHVISPHQPIKNNDGVTINAKQGQPNFVTGDAIAVRVVLSAAEKTTTFSNNASTIILELKQGGVDLNDMNKPTNTPASA